MKLTIGQRTGTAFALLTVLLIASGATGYYAASQLSSAQINETIANLQARSKEAVQTIEHSAGRTAERVDHVI